MGNVTNEFIFDEDEKLILSIFEETIDGDYLQINNITEFQLKCIFASRLLNKDGLGIKCKFKMSQELYYCELNMSKILNLLRIMGKEGILYYRGGKETYLSISDAYDKILEE